VKLQRLFSFILALILLCLSCPAALAAGERTLSELVEEIADEEAEREVERAELHRVLSRAAEILCKEAGALQKPDGLLTYSLLCQDLCAFLETAGARLPRYHKEVRLPEGHTEAELLIADAMVIPDDEFAEPEKAVTYGELTRILERFFILMEAETDAGALFGAPKTTVERSEARDESYFEDVCMIGHSQARAYSHYSTIPMTVYAMNGAKARETVKYVRRMPEDKLTRLDTALAQEQYNVVYFMYGVNDCRSGLHDPNGFIQGMKLHIELVEKTQKAPLVFLLSVCPMMEYRQKTYPYETVAIYNINRMIYGIARYYGYEYLNMYEVLGDENGYLRGDIDCADGLHFGANGYERLTEYLLCHTVS